MDILAQYDKEKPRQELVSRNVSENQSEDYGPIIGWIIKISRGRIENERQANIILIMGAFLLVACAFWLLASPASRVPSQKIINAALQKTVMQLKQK